MERLTYRGTEVMTEDGLIRPSYSDYPITRIIERLAEYEDAEEQGLLLRLPCKVGDTVYRVYQEGEYCVSWWTIEEIKFTLSYYEKNKDNLGKTIFLTQAEAEQKLKEMENE